MAAPKRTAFERERDLDRIAELYLQGKTQAEIAIVLASEREYAVTRQTIARDLRTVQERWQASATEKLSAARARELAKIDRLERTYWEAWERSCQARTISSAEECIGAGGLGRGMQRKGIRREEQGGNPAYLAGVLQCIERRCRLLGLDAPDRHEMIYNEPDDFRGESRETLLEIITEQLNIRGPVSAG